MKRDNINYLVVGVFVLGLFAALLVVLYQITGRTGPVDRYYITFANITGIKFGTPVLYEGFQVGQVESIVPEREPAGTRYRLAISVTRGWLIPEDSTARVLASGLLGAISIDIAEGESSAMLAPGAEIRSEEPVNLFVTINEAVADIRDLISETARPLLNNLNQHFELLTRDLTTLTEEDLRPLLRNVNRALEQPQLVEEANRLLAGLNESAARLGELLNETNVENVGQILGNIEQASQTLNELLDRINETRDRMDQVLANIDSLVQSNRSDIQLAVRDLRQSLDVISGQIDAIAYNLEGSSRNLHEFTRTLRANPSALLRGAPQSAGEAPE
jgi:phospholipid/cholesterol/gamma-HCH transport system substrate-binding protein